MKKAERIWKILLVIFLVTVWCNIGHHNTEIWQRANDKHFQKEELSLVEKFQLGPNRFWKKENLVGRVYSFIEMVRNIILWPVALAFVLLSWVVFIAYVALVFIWGKAVFLFKFIFLGGFFELIGPEWSVVVCLAFIGIMVRLIVVVRRKRKKKKAEKEEKKAEKKRKKAERKQKRKQKNNNKRDQKTEMKKAQQLDLGFFSFRIIAVDFLFFKNFVRINSYEQIYKKENCY